MKIFITGVNGFIGHHLTRHILAKTDWEIYGIDIASDRLDSDNAHSRFHFLKGDMASHPEWVEASIKECDVVLPLAAIATPAAYVRDPLRVFELDFEANLVIVRATVSHKKRLIFPSTSEVYGMSDEIDFDPDTTRLVYGPIRKSRWIYACAKQMMDRLIFAYGQQHALRFTLFRPFNWIGPDLDRLDPENKQPVRVVMQFLGHIMRNEPISLVGGGRQRRCFTAIDDGICALMRIIENPLGIADGKIYNIGSPENNFSISELANTMLRVAMEFKEYSNQAMAIQIHNVEGTRFYGLGYEDVTQRVPNIDGIRRDLGWSPKISLDNALRDIFKAHRHWILR
jgi:nucleoside-diphosphate-sugar epimerase